MNPVAIVVFVVVFIISCILFGVSFDTLEPTQVGIAFNANTQKIDTTTLYDEGRYLIGLGQSFIPFPRTAVSVRFGTFKNPNPQDAGIVYARTSDGMIAQLSISFQFVLKQNINDLVSLYMDFGDNYALHYSRIARGVIYDVAAHHPAMDYFVKRATISREMLSVLNETLDAYYANVLSLEIINMDFDSSFALAIEQTQVAVQDIEQAQYEQNVAAVKASSDVASAQQIATVLLSQANATALSNLARARADADVLSTRIKAQADSFLSLKQQLGLSTASQVLDYLYLLAVQENAANNLVVNFPKPSGFV